MAYYDDVHLVELEHIRTARARGVPLFAIREQLGKPSNRAAADATRAGMAPRRRGRPPGRGEMRAAILDAGCRLFLRKGFGATAVSDITARLKVGKGTFYFYFSDKEELFLECAPRIFQELFAASWERIRQERNPLRRLDLRARAVVPVLDQFCAILALSREALRSADPKLRGMGKRTLASICRPLAEDLSTGMSQGLIRPLDPKATSVMLIGVMESLQYLRAAGARLTPHDLPDAVSALILSGLRAGNGAGGLV
jgi:AcrR family transcriptional regulator